MNARGIAGFLLGLVVVGLLVSIGIGAYQAGVTQGVIDAGRFPVGADVPVAGFGAHGGPGILGILFGIFLLFLLFGLIRAALWRGRGWGPGWGHGYGDGPGRGRGFRPDAAPGAGPDGGPEWWREERDRRLTDWHRRLHESEGDKGAAAR